MNHLTHVLFFKGFESVEMNQTYLNPELEQLSVESVRTSEFNNVDIDKVNIKQSTLYYLQ